MSRICSILIASLLAGCMAPPRGADPAPPSDSHVMTMSHEAAPAPADAPRDPAAAQQYIFQVDVYRLAVPMGTFSSNEEFWKRMDEQCVDVSTYDLLYKNGIRVGRAPISELDYFKKFMDERLVMKRMTTTSAEAQRIELEMKTDVPAQTIAIFQPELRMQDYDGSNNIINMSFQPAPRKPRELRLTLCPMVRAQRKHYQTTLLNNDFEIRYVSPEMFYDLNLCVDIPNERFFIVMPSAFASLQTSVGRAFLTQDGPVNRLEEILLIIPHPMPLPAENR